ncbi:hydrogenase formation protein HypD, partial [Patescibacteria group bacterium]|nr:hydrogenase formation protein HypD [Patescibacteria group bacterium]MBU1421245.1 hydrogenase formation protein HypD [Patescibacteria group bacterium]MBU2456875.1 hydrogenase formation protein HypD [Patescibacteria group bacterium]
LRQIKNKESKAENEYNRVVKNKGNIIAQKIINNVFEICDKGWRGIGTIPNSGLKLKNKFAKFDAEKRFGIKIKKSQDIKPGCKCGEIMKGKAMPQDCPYFGKSCIPENPTGACMVSIEGACYIAYNYS